MLIAPEDALWLEVKVVAQHAYAGGVPGPNSAYASELKRGPIADCKKLAADPRIVHAAVIVVLFTADMATARHDLPFIVHKALDLDLPVSSPQIRHIRIGERIGNHVCTVCWLELRKLGLHLP